jgi:hypothetical protein
LNLKILSDQRGMTKVIPIEKVFVCICLRLLLFFCDFFI